MTKTWDGGGGNGDWGNLTNWNGDTLPATTDDILFDNSSQSVLGDVFLNAARTVQSLTLNLSAGSSNWNLGADDSTTAFTLNLSLGSISVLSTSGTGTYTIGATSGAGIGTGVMTLATSGSGFTLDNARTNGGILQINAIVSGTSKSVTKAGLGTVVLSGANSYTGATTVSAGILNIQSATGLGTTAGGTTVSNNATLQLQNSGTIGAEALSINGAGASGQNGALVNVGGTNNYGGLITLAGASTISSDSGTLNLTNASTMTGATFGLTLTGAGNGTLSSIIGTTTGGVTKSGAGIWTLSGVNTYTGVTTLSGGTLSVATIGAGGVAGNLGKATSTASNLVFNGGALRYTGVTASTNRNFTINSGKTAIFDINANILTLTGTTTSTNGGLTKMGAGTLTLSGANTYTGATTVSAGTLKAGIVSVPNTSGAFGNNSTLTLANTAGATLDITGFNTQIDSLNGGGGTGGNVTLGAATLTLAGNNLSPATFGGVISGTGGLTKNGAGTQTLSGANTYTGLTMVNGGTLTIDGSLGDHHFRAFAGATVNINGTINSPTSSFYLSGTAVDPAVVTVGSSGSLTTAELMVGYSNGSSDIFNLGGGSVSAPTAYIGFQGDGTFNLSSGSLTTGQTQVGLFLSGTFNQSGGTHTATTYIYLGNDGFSGVGNYNLSAGALSTPDLYVGYGGIGTFTQSGGTSTITNSLRLGTNTGSSGIYNLNGGTVKASTVIRGLGAGTFNFDGGILQASQTTTTFMSGLTAANILAGGAVIDSNSFNITIGQPLLHGGVPAIDGGLNKLGAGTLTLSGANTYTGATTVTGGILQAGIVSIANTSGAFGNNSALTLASTSGVSLNITGFNTQIGSLTGGGSTGGNVILGAATLTVGGDNSSPVGYAGAISGTGGVTKIGTGNWNLFGASTYTGYTAVNGGSLEIIAGGSMTGTNITVATGATFNIRGIVDTSSKTVLLDGTVASPATATLFSGGALTTSMLTVSSTAGAGGVFNLSGGAGKTTLLTAQYIYVGLNGTGVFNFSGGSIAGSQTQVGMGGIGTFTHTGGTQTLTSFLSLGINAGSSGTYNLSAGSLSAFTLENGYTGSGTFNQSGGTNTISTYLRFGINAGGSGTYNLDGGTLTLPTMTRGAGTGTFVFNGGTLQTSQTTTGFMSGLTAANIVAGGALIDSNSFNITIGQPLLHGGVPAIDGGLNKLGAGTLTLSGANTFTGPTTVTAGILKAGVVSIANTSGAFGNNSALTLANTSGVSLNITGFNTQIGSLAGGGTTGGNVTLGAATLTVGGDNSSPAPYSGAISGTGGVTKIGTGTQTLSGANSFTGATTISGGILRTNSNSALNGTTVITVNSGGTLLLAGTANTTRVKDTAPITLNGGGKITLGETADAANTTEALGALTLVGGTTLDFASTSATTGFVATFSSLAALPASGVVTILNWNGTIGAAGTTGLNDRMIFTSNSLGLVNGSLTNTIQFDIGGQLYSGEFLSVAGGLELVAWAQPVPEPSTVLGGCLALAALGYHQRRALRLFARTRFSKNLGIA